MSHINSNLLIDTLEQKLNPEDYKLCEKVYLDWYDKVLQCIQILENYKTMDSDFLQFYTTLYKLSRVPTIAKELGSTTQTYLYYLQRQGFFDITPKIPKVTIHMNAEERKNTKGDQTKILKLWEEIKNIDGWVDVVGVIATESVKPLISSSTLNKFHSKN